MGEYGIVYENEKFIVTDNGSDELIIQNKKGDMLQASSIRVTTYGNEITVVTQTGEFRLFHANGLNGVITKSS